MNQNKEVTEQPQWMVDILDRLDKLEDTITSLKNDILVLGWIK